MATYSEIYHSRIARGLSPQEIRARYEAMIADEQAIQTSNMELAPEERARQNLGYILGYFDKTTCEEWYAALPMVNHPIFGHGFGRGNDPTPEEAFDLGKKFAENT